MNDADIIALVSFEDVDAAHLTNLLPIVEQDVQCITIVGIFESYYVVAKFCPKVTGVHSLANDIFARM